MPEMHLRQLEFMYKACGLITKNKTRIQKCKETGESRYIYRNELDKTCFQRDMAYGDFKDLPRRMVSDEVVRGKAITVVSNSHYGYQHGLASILYRFFDEKAGDITTHT